jgi:hypothetical protein
MEKQNADRVQWMKDFVSLVNRAPQVFEFLKDMPTVRKDGKPLAVDDNGNIVFSEVNPDLMEWIYNKVPEAVLANL